MHRTGYKVQVKICFVLFHYISCDRLWIAATTNGEEGEDPVKLSARNVFKGRVVNLTHGAVNSEIILELPGGLRVVSIITRQSADSLEIKEGADAYAVIKATNVMLAVD